MSLPENLSKPLDVLLIDNFDSFTWNLYQSICLLGADVTVIRNDAIPASALPLLNIRSLIISPGPGHPTTDSGISRDAIRYFTGKVPVLGVCMGLECLVDVYGGDIGYAGEIKHGKLSPIRHDGRGCFKGIPQSIMSTRYHSLSASLKTLPKDLMITCATEESGVIMGVRHREYVLEAVQYHPESILSESGDDLLRNFLSFKGGYWKENPESLVLDPALPPFPYEALEGKLDGPAKSKAPSILEKIYAQRTKDVLHAKTVPGTTPSDLDTLLSMHLAPPLVPLVSRLKAKKPALMAEIKRASPSKGNIALTANAAQQALTYALSGASVISVLTEPTWFKGMLLDMRLARQAIDLLPNRPAILRKDFILDEYQIAEARLHGADTVLLIVAMIPEDRLKELYDYSLSLGMEPLVEVNNAREMVAALELGAKVIGVNNRNLHTFDVDMGTTSRLVDMVRERDVILCALSGISSPEDVRQYAEQGVGAVLVGEALMRAKDTKAFIHELLNWQLPPPQEPKAPLVKICGIRSVEEASAVADAGADLLGLMFVPSSKRAISLSTARDISLAIRSSRSTNSVPSKSPSLDELANDNWFATHAHRLSNVPQRPLLVGVFQNQPLSDILDIVSTAQLDIVQLHGIEPAGWAKHIPVPVIRVFHVSASGDGLDDITRPGLHEYVLLDSQRSGDGLSGGSGKKLDWDLAKRIVQAGELVIGESTQSVTSTPTNGVNGAHVSKAPMPIMLAGGLTPENVREAIEKVRPWAVDVSGGVETSDGKGKDIAQVVAFIAAVKQT
ncbi:indole-3-glycerol phosphate synthase-domain-containing protein [Hygrophoropsis aurantiaca]|uniref:Indole-3-glycerol phosphate synthase-domain-containing protein n=1 Tax=Hygrophoropsis aurantiaca TaxID=72124 RepID=A0ACB8ANW2_9AGAM|nr:indole-3-glycerol phosphate synthase-domain-containing protein [Hygrophoropsis aurantiaca]